MPRTYEMASGYVANPDGRPTPDGSVVVIRLTDAEDGPIVPASTLRRADGSAWPTEGVVTDGDAKVIVQVPGSGPFPDLLYSDTGRGRWPMLPVDLSARLSDLEENGGGGGLTDEQAEALTRVPQLVKVSDFGGTAVAVDGDGFPSSGTPTNSTTAVLASIAALQPGDTWRIDGHYCWKDSQVAVPVDGITVDSTGGSLICTTTHSSTSGDGKYSSVAFTGDDVTVKSLVLRVDNVAHRRGSYDLDAALVVRGDNFTGRGIDIDGSWQIGIALIGAANYRLDAPEVRNTRADGIQELGGCVDGRMFGPSVTNSGDDGISSYSAADGSRPNSGGRVIGATVTNTGARGLAVLGGSCDFEDFTVNGTDNAALYVSAETNLPAGLTHPARDIHFTRGTITNACRDSTVTHNAMTLVSFQADGGIDHVYFSDITIGPTPVGGVGGFAILSRYNSGRLEDVYFEDITADVSHGNEVFLFNSLPASSYRIVRSKRSSGATIPTAGTAGVVAEVTPEAVQAAGADVFVAKGTAVETVAPGTVLELGVATDNVPAMAVSTANPLANGSTNGIGRIPFIVGGVVEFVEVNLAALAALVPAGAPGAPTINFVSNTAVAEKGTLGFGWLAPSNVGTGITSYEPRYRRSSDSTWTIWPGYPGLGATDDYDIITGLEAVEYTVQVRAYTTAGPGPWSASATGTPLPVENNVAGEQRDTFNRADAQALGVSSDGLQFDQTPLEGASGWVFGTLNSRLAIYTAANGGEWLISREAPATGGYRVGWKSGGATEYGGLNQIALFKSPGNFIRVTQGNILQRVNNNLEALLQTGIPYGGDGQVVEVEFSADRTQIRHRVDAGAWSGWVTIDPSLQGERTCGYKQDYPTALGLPLEQSEEFWITPVGA